MDQPDPFCKNQAWIYISYALTYQQEHIGSLVQNWGNIIGKALGVTAVLH